VLALATAVGSTGLAAGGTAGALLGVEITGTEAAAGLPLGLLVVGSAATTATLSNRPSRSVMRKFGLKAVTSGPMRYLGVHRLDHLATMTC
jgi:hypothetical protein